MMKGVVAYTLSANHVPITTEMIGPNERDSHFVFDLLSNNLTDIYVDLLSLRSYVHVNRGTSYHKFHCAVSHTNYGRLHFKTEGEQLIWNERGRLIANYRIFYNATILSDVLRYPTENGKSSSKVSMEKVSPIACQQVNFYGRFEFTKSFQSMDIDAFAHELVSRSGSSPRLDRLLILFWGNCKKSQQGSF